MSNPFIQMLDLVKGMQEQEPAQFASRYQQATGAGNVRAAQATRLDQDLRGAAAASPMANVMGAAASMAQSGVLPKELSTAILGKDEAARRKAFSDLDIGAGPDAFMKKMLSMGVGADVSTKFLSDQKANQENIKKLGIGNIVRNMQATETNDILQQHLSSELISAYRGKGADRNTAVKDAARLSGDMMNELSRLAKEDPTILGEKRSGDLAKKMKEKFNDVPGGIENLMGTLKERMKSDPSINKFGDLHGAMTMGLQGAAIGDDIRQGRMKRLNDLKGQLGGENMNAGERADVNDRLDKLSEMGEVNRGPATTKGDGGKVTGAGSGNDVHITGTIKLDAGGMGHLEAQSQGAAPGGD